MFIQNITNWLRKEMDLMEEIKHEYELCIQKPHKYKRKVNSISDLLLLKGNRRFIDIDCPVYSWKI